VFLDVTEQWFGNALFLLVIEAELHGVVAVLAGLRLDLQYTIRSGQNDRDRV